MLLSRCPLALLFAGQLALLSSAAPAAPPATPPVARLVVPVRADTKADEADQILVDLVTNSAGGFNEKAFTKGEYKTIRAAFARYFEAR